MMCRERVQERRWDSTADQRQCSPNHAVGLTPLLAQPARCHIAQVQVV